MAGRVRARRRLPAGAEDVGRDLPRGALRDAGYSAVWHGQKGFNGVAILARGDDLVESRRGLPGDADDTHSRYIEATTHGLVVGSIYLPNGNPQPGPKFAYRLAWSERLAAHAASLIESGRPVVLAGDYNVVATDEVGDIYSPRSYLNDALLQPGRAAPTATARQGWIDSIRTCTPASRSTPTGTTSASASRATPGLRIDHLLLNAPAFSRLESAGVDRFLRAREKPSDHAPTWITLSAEASRASAAQDGRKSSG